MDFSLRKSSFNNNSPHGSNESNGNNNDDDDDPIMKNSPKHGDDDVIVNVDVMKNTSSPLLRGSSGEFSFPTPYRRQPSTGGNSGECQPSNKEKNEMLLDMDMDMEELHHQDQHHQQQQQPPRSGGLPPLHPYGSWSRNLNDIITPSSDGGLLRETRVSFHESLTSDLIKRPSSMSLTSDLVRRQSSSSMYSRYIQDDSSSCSSSSLSRDDENIAQSAEIRRSNTDAASFRRIASMSLSKTKSRLIDRPSTPIIDHHHKSGQLNTKSGLLGKTSLYEDEEDDPLLDRDEFTEGFKRSKMGRSIILEWVSLGLIMCCLVFTLTFPNFREKTFWNMKLWKWEVLILAIICGRLVSNWGIRVVVYLLERIFLLKKRKRVLYFVYGLKKDFQNVIWLALILVTWYFLFDKRVQLESRSEQLRFITKILIVSEIGAILWFLKTLLVKVLASNFHVKAFFDRIQESLFNQFVIETLSAPPLFEIDQTQEEVERAMVEEVQSLQNAEATMPPELRVNVFSRFFKKTPSKKNLTPEQPNATPYKSSIGRSFRYSGLISKKHDDDVDDGIPIEHLQKLNQKNVSAWNMKRLMKIIRYGSLTTLDEQIVGVTTQDDDSSTHIRSEVEAKAAARKIFRNVARPHSRYIYLDDILRFMKEDEALRTMGLFEGAIENERISKKSLKNWVVNAFRERRALALTLSDTKTAVNKLHKMVNVLVSIILIIFGVIFLNIITSQSLLFLSSQVVVVAFVFGNTCKNVFESIIFLFVVHPFDVGDRCEIDGVQMVVEEINILTTVFLRFDNQKIVFPNYILLTKPIPNYYRSPDMGDGIELCFHIATPPEKITVIKQRITSYIDNKKEHWYPDPMVVLKDTDGLNMLRIAVWLQHRMNHQDMGERWARRGLLIEECIKIFREMDIEYRVYPMNVNVTSIPPLNYAQVPPSSWNASHSESGKEFVHP